MQLIRHNFVNHLEVEISVFYLLYNPLLKQSYIWDVY